MLTKCPCKKNISILEKISFIIIIYISENVPAKNSPVKATNETVNFKVAARSRQKQNNQMNDEHAPSSQTTADQHRHSPWHRKLARKQTSKSQKYANPSESKSHSQSPVVKKAAADQCCVVAPSLLDTLLAERTVIVKGNQI